MLKLIFISRNNNLTWDVSMDHLYMFPYLLSFLTDQQQQFLSCRFSSIPTRTWCFLRRMCFPDWRRSFLVFKIFSAGLNALSSAITLKRWNWTTTLWTRYSSYCVPDRSLMITQNTRNWWSPCFNPTMALSIILSIFGRQTTSWTTWRKNFKQMN